MVPHQRDDDPVRGPAARRLEVLGWAAIAPPAGLVREGAVDDRLDAAFRRRRDAAGRGVADMDGTSRGDRGAGAAALVAPSVGTAAARSLATARATFAGGGWRLSHKQAAPLRAPPTPAAARGLDAGSPAVEDSYCATRSACLPSWSGVVVALTNSAPPPLALSLAITLGAEAVCAEPRWPTHRAAPGPPAKAVAPPPFKKKRSGRGTPRPPISVGAGSYQCLRVRRAGPCSRCAGLTHRFAAIDVTRGDDTNLLVAFATGAAGAPGDAARSGCRRGTCRAGGRNAPPAARFRRQWAGRDNEDCRGGRCAVCAARPADSS